MGLNEELKDIKELLKKQGEENDKKKEFKIPFFKRVGKKQAQQNYVTVMKINENGHTTFKKQQIDEQTIIEDGIPRLATPEHVLFYKKNPMLILPSWSVKPYSPAEQYQKSMNDGSNTKGYSILLARMHKEQINPKRQMSGLLKWIIGFAVAGIIVFALFTGGG